MKLYILILIFILIILNGCASVFKGYYDKVEIQGFTADLEIYTIEGVKIPIESRKEQLVSNDFDLDKRKWYKITKDTVHYSISLRSKYKHVLRLKNESKEKVIELYPKVGSGWLLLDILTGIVPGIFDAYTGSWNHFDDIKITNDY